MKIILPYSTYSSSSKMKRSQGSTPIIMMFNSTLLIVQLLHSVLKTHPAEAAIAIIHFLKLVNSSLSLFFSFHRPPMWQCEWVARRALWLEKLWPLVICQSEASEARKACLIHCKASWLKPPSEVSWRSLLHLYYAFIFCFEFEEKLAQRQNSYADDDLEHLK